MEEDWQVLGWQPKRSKPGLVTIPDSLFLRISPFRLVLELGVLLCSLRATSSCRKLLKFGSECHLLRLKRIEVTIHAPIRSLNVDRALTITNVGVGLAPERNIVSNRDGVTYQKVSVEYYHANWAAMTVDQRLPFYQKAQARLDEHIAKNPKQVQPDGASETSKVVKLTDKVSLAIRLRLQSQDLKNWQKLIIPGR